MTFVRLQRTARAASACALLLGAVAALSPAGAGGPVEAQGAARSGQPARATRPVPPTPPPTATPALPAAEPAAPAPPAAPAAQVAPPPPAPFEGSPEAAIRAAVDARPWAGTLYVGSSVADGKLRDIAFAPWTGTWGDDTLVSGSVSRRLGRFWTFFTVDLELGTAYRFGDTEGGEFWAALFLRYDGFPWTRYLYTTFALSFGPDYVTRLPQVERGTDLRPEPNQSAWLNFFSPEFTFALPDSPWNQLVIRYMHRSGIFGTYGGVYEGANSLVFGYRYRF